MRRARRAFSRRSERRGVPPRGAVPSAVPGVRECMGCVGEKFATSLKKCGIKDSGKGGPECTATKPGGKRPRTSWSGGR
jgi:hypothetical protein